MRISDWSSDVCSSDLNSFDDTQGSATNYMVDLPAGATGRIANNLFVQGSDKENRSALIAVAAEGADNPSRGLAIRSEEHTSELQSLMRISYAVFCLKKKKIKPIAYTV